MQVAWAQMLDPRPVFLCILHAFWSIGDLFGCFIVCIVQVHPDLSTHWPTPERVLHMLLAPDVLDASTGSSMAMHCYALWKKVGQYFLRSHDTPWSEVPAAEETGRRPPPCLQPTETLRPAGVSGNTGTEAMDVAGEEGAKLPSSSYRSSCSLSCEHVQSKAHDDERDSQCLGDIGN